MDIQYFENPVPHFIIDNFLTDRASREVLEEAIDLEPFYEQAKVEGYHEEANHMETCMECKRNAETFKNTIRDNQTIYLDKTFENQRNVSKTLTYMHKALDDVEFHAAMEKANYLFPLMNQVNTTETLISRYGKCDFYGWHTDTLSKSRETRILTISYYINKEPLKFNGGRFMFLNKITGEKKIIEPKHNTAVVFMSSSAFHCVEYVDLTGKNWEDGRFSVQFWLGFNNTFKFRE